MKQEHTSRMVGFVAGLGLAVVAVVLSPGCGRSEPEVVEVEVNPPTAEVISGEKQRFAAVGTTAEGEEVEITPGWKVEGNIGKVGQDGSFSALAAGSGNVIASLGPVEGRAEVTVVAGPPAKLTLEAESGTLAAGQATQLTARLVDGQDNPVSDEALDFSVDGDQPSLSGIEAETSSEGTATATLTLPTTPGDATVIAEAAGLTAQVVVSGVPGPPAKLETSVKPPRVLTQEAAVLTVRVSDQYGNPVKGVDVQLAAKTAGTSLEASSASTDSTGVATTRVTTAEEPGSNHVQVSVAQLPVHTASVQGVRLSSITIDPDGAEVASGSQLEFTALGFDGSGTEVPVDVRWSVTGAVGEIDASGRFTATTAGEGRVKASARTVTGTVSVITVPGPLTKIKVTPAEATVASGDGLRFECTGRDAAGNEVVVSPRWEAAETTGEIDESGAFTARMVGKGIISASAQGITGRATVVVTPGTLATMRIDPEDVALAAGTRQQLTVTGLDRAGNECSVSPTWTVSPALGKIDSDAVFHAAKVGAADIVAVSGTVAAKARVEVVPGKLAEIVVTPAGVEIASGTSFQFTAVGRDEHGNEVPVEPTWGVTGEAGKVSDAGLFTGVTAGKGEVVASAGTVDARTMVTVIPGSVVRLEITPEKATVVAGSKQDFKIQGFDAAGNQKSVTPQWTVVGGIGEVSPQGLFTARRAGAGEVLAGGYEGVSAKAEVIVQPAKLSTIAVSPASATVRSGASQRFSAAGSDAYGNDIPVEPRWTVTGGIGTVDPETGELVAVTAGEGTVVATARGVGGLAEVRVESGDLAVIKVAPVPVLEAGETCQLSAVGLDENGNQVPISPVWSVDGEAGSVDESGLLVARRAGRGKVVAAAGEIAGSTEVETVPGAPVELEITPASATVASGAAQQLAAVAADSYGNQVSISPQWTVRGGIGSVDQSGVFTAAAAGSGQVVVSAGALTSAADITVVPGELESISVVPRGLEVPAGATARFAAVGVDRHGNEIEIKPKWSVTAGVGEIDPQGLFAATAQGKGAVLATYQGIVGSAEVTTVPGSLSELRVLPAEAEIDAGGTQQFTAKGLDQHGNVIEDVAATWSVVGGAGTVEEDAGVFTAVTPGECRVVAISGGTQATAMVKVVPGRPSAERSSVSISPQAVEAGGSATAVVIVNVRDLFGNPVRGVPVTVTSSRADDNVEPAEGETDANGIARFEVSSTAAGESAVTAVVAGVSLAPASVEFTGK